MKPIYIIIPLIFLATGLSAQINAYYVLSSMGGDYKTSSGQTVSNTLGEMFISTRQINGKTITEGFQQGYMKYKPDGIALPVTLLSFDGVNQGTINHLTWETAAEIENAGFYVERMKKDGEFEQIGFVSGHGTTNTLSDYSFDDDHFTIGNNYYRLNQVDADGHSSCSNVVALFSGELVDLDMQVYPVPVADAANILIHSNGDITGNVTITNVVGAVVYQNDLHIYSGTTINKIGLDSYAPGQYFIKLVTGSTTKTIHIVKD